MTIYLELFDVVLFRTILMTYKHKTHAVDIDGKITSNADVDFYIDDVCPLIFFSYILCLSVENLISKPWYGQSHLEFIL